MSCNKSDSEAERTRYSIHVQSRVESRNGLNRKQTVAGHHVRVVAAHEDQCLEAHAGWWHNGEIALLEAHVPEHRRNCEKSGTKREYANILTTRVEYRN